MAKILVIEDEESLQLLLDFDLKSRGYNVEVCNDGLIGLTKLQNNNYDLTIVDWMIPSLSGYDVIKEIRKTNTKLKIIMLTAKDDEMDIVNGLEVGADDYLTKPFSSRELGARIKALLRSSSLTKKKIIEFDDIVIDKAQRLVKKNNINTKISKIEFDLLVLLAENQNIVISREMMIEKIWGLGSNVDDRIVDVHISSLKKKLDLKERIRSKRGVGYFFFE